RLAFICNQQDAVPVADFAEFLQKDSGRNNVAALALNRLNENGGNFFRRNRSLEDFFFNEARAAQSVCFVIHAAGISAISVGIRNVGDAGNQRRKAATLLRLGSCERKRAHGAPVEGSEEGDDVLATGMVAGDLQRALNGLGSRVAVVEAVRAG